MVYLADVEGANQEFRLRTMKALGPSIGLRLKYRVRSTKEETKLDLLSESWDVMETLSSLSLENETFCSTMSMNKRIHLKN